MAACVIAAALFGWLLQPNKPALGEAPGYQKFASSFELGANNCTRLRRPHSDPRTAQKECAAEIEQQREALGQYVEARRAADAAHAQAIEAFEQASIAAWGTGLALVTMLSAIAAALFAGRAAYHTKRSANVAEEAVRTSKKLGEAQVRCYLTITEARVKLNGSIPVLQIKVRNSGQSPARSVRAQYGFTPDIGYDFSYDIPLKFRWQCT